MERLWAPWRMEFIKSEREPGCIFCTKPADREHWRDHGVLHVGAKAFVILNRYPYNNGHLMVIPRRHTAEYSDLGEEELRELQQMLQASLVILKEQFQAEGFNVGLNLGRAAGAGIAEHLHYHVVPRWVADTNFMPVLGSVRMMPEHLLATYDRLQPQFEQRLKE